MPVHTITIAKKQWSPLIFNMATIFTKEVKDVHLEHSSGHTPARLKAFSQLFVKKSLARKGPICGAPEYQSAYFEVDSGTLWSTWVHQTRVPIWVFFEKRLMNQPSFQFIYPDWYSSSPSSGTNLGILLKEVDESASFQRIPHLLYTFNSQKKLKFSQFLSLHII